MTSVLFESMCDLKGEILNFAGDPVGNVKL